MNTEQAYKLLERFCKDAEKEIASLREEKEKQLSIIKETQALTEKYSSNNRLMVTQKYDSIRKKLDLFHTIAREHTTLRLEDLNEVAAEPNFPALSALAAKIDKYNYNDPKANELLRKLSANFRWVEKAFEKEMKAAEAMDLPMDSEEYGQMKSIYESQEAILKTELLEKLGNVADAAKTMEEAAQQAEIKEEDFTAPPMSFAGAIPLFGVQRKIEVPEPLKEEFAGILKNSYDKESSCLSYPYYADIRGGFRLALNYTKDLYDVYEEISTVVLHLLRSVPPKQLKISLIDRVSYSQNMIRELLPLEGVVDPPCSNENEIGDYLLGLEKEYRAIEKRLGAGSVHTQNKENPDLPYRLIVLHENDYGNYTGRESLKYLRENARTLGITFIHVVRQGKDSVKEPDGGYDVEVSEKDGAFFLKDGSPVKLLSSSVVPSAEFKTQLIPSEEEKKITNLFFDYVPFTTGHKGKRKRGSVSVPFGIDEYGNLVEADFTNTNFAAFMEGSAGSGKSSLLHSIIMGLMMKYHPDEMELWLADFKMTEFADYGKWKLPHVKCVLLESSEELVFDLVDQLMNKLNERKVQFSKAGWKGMKDVPYDVYMPEIFVIIDEFGDMSKVLQQTGGEGADKNYRDKVEYLLRESRSFGFHYIFSNQAFTEGSQGLTEMAKLQIRSRFALLNDRGEINAILNAGSSTDDRVKYWIDNMRPFETLFRVEENGEFVIRKYKNLYIPEQDRPACYQKIKDSFVPQEKYSPDDDRFCVRRDLVMIDGTVPQSFRENRGYMVEKEEELYLHKGDIVSYAGAPMSFDRVAPFVLRKQVAENVLLVGNDPRGDASVVRSILDSVNRAMLPCEIWADEANSVFESYGRSLFGDVPGYTELGEICARVEALKDSIKKKKNSPQLIVVMGYERICNSLELMADLWNDEEDKQKEKTEIPVEDIFELVERFNESTDPQERQMLKAKIDEFNEFVSRQKDGVAEVPVYDAREDIRKLVKLGPVFGIRFLFVFEKAAAFQMARLDMSAFSHKLLFSMSRDDAIQLDSNRQHPELLPAGCFIYTDGQRRISMRPYIVKGLPLYPEWEVDDDGNVSERRI